MLFEGTVIDGIRIKQIVFEDNNIKLCKTLSNDNVLISNALIYKRWIDEKLIYDVNPFIKVLVNQQEYFYLKSNKQFQLGLIKNNGITISRQTALNFAFSLKQMRKITNVSLYDGIYIEEFNYILPTYTIKDVSDDALLGYYFSGNENKHFSEGGFRSLFLSEADFEEIAELVNIEIDKKPEIEPIKQEEKKIGKFTLTGRPELEKFFNEHIINILNEPERYKKLGIDFPSSIILYGPPGCGKTYAVDKLVEFLDLPKYEINSSTIASPYIHDTSKKISAMFEAAANSAPSVVVIDEMESYMSDRNSFGESSHHTEEVAEFLRQIQEANKKHVLVIAMTNLLDKIDPAILRKGRFDHHIEVGYPSEEEIKSLLEFLLAKISVSKEIDISVIASKLVGKSLADVSFVIKEAALISGKMGLDEISSEAIDEAIQILPKKEERIKLGFGV